MKKTNIFMLATSILFVILLILCICLQSVEGDVIQNYDRESTVTIDGTDGCILVKEKKYDYDGSDVMILSVENQTENAYTMIIKSCFTKEDSTTEHRVQLFHGFPSGYQNYFVLQPGFRFVDFEYEIVTRPYSKETLAEHISWESDVSVEAQPFTTDLFGKSLDEYITDFNCYIYRNFEFPENTKISITRDIVIFDNLGEIYIINNQARSYGTVETSEKSSGVENIYGKLLDTPWKDYKLPFELKGDVKAIVALKSIELVEE